MFVNRCFRSYTISLYHLRNTIPRNGLHRRHEPWHNVINLLKTRQNRTSKQDIGGDRGFFRKIVCLVWVRRGNSLETKISLKTKSWNGQWKNDQPISVGAATRVIYRCVISSELRSSVVYIFGWYIFDIRLPSWYYRQIYLMFFIYYPRFGSLCIKKYTAPFRLLVIL